MYEEIIDVSNITFWKQIDVMLCEITALCISYHGVEFNIFE